MTKPDIGPSIFAVGDYDRVKTPVAIREAGFAEHLWRYSDHLDYSGISRRVRIPRWPGSA